MVTGISGSSEKNYLQQLMMKLMQGTSGADSTSGLSKSDLSSVDTSADSAENTFVKALSDNFDKIDTNGDGKLSEDEIKSVIKKPMGPPPGLLKELESADTDGTTGLSKDELSSIDTKNNKGESHFIKNLTDNFDKLDTNGDGQLSSDEIAASKPQGPPPTENSASGTDSLSKESVNILEKLISDMDTNKDGTVSKDELTAFVNDHSSNDTTKTASTSSSNSSSSNNDSSSDSSSSNKLSSLADYFIKQLVNAYKEHASDINSTISSALNVSA